jgi:hypothetical protein
MTYFSDREQGERLRDVEDISPTVWGGIQALIRTRIDDGSFGAGYPGFCPDGRSPIGTDAGALWLAIQAEIPGLTERPWYGGTEERPTTMQILDLIEFCWRCVGKPEQGSYHGFFDHHHLSFDVDAGRAAFRTDVNRIFGRNGLAYELTDEGRIERLAPPVLRDDLAAAIFRTGDAELDRMLETARRKFLDPDEEIRREALEALWDAWERIKTLGGPDKKAQTTALLYVTAAPSSPKFLEALVGEARELTALGNSLQIRHSETSQERLASAHHVDYLFHRLFSLIQLILRANGKM